MSAPDARAAGSPTRRCGGSSRRTPGRIGRCAAAASRYGLEGRERAQAQALAYGAVQRRGTSDHFVARARRAARSSASTAAACGAAARPLRAALRPRRCRSRGGRPGGRARQGPRRPPPRGRAGQRGAAPRRARAPGSCSRGLDDGDPEGAAVAHSVPPWIARLWWEELGADRARSLLAAINEPPERALRANRLAGDRDAALTALRSVGVEAEVADPGRPPAPARLARRHRWRAREGRGADRRRTGRAAVARPALVVELLAPAPGERVLDLCAGPGIKAEQIAAALGRRWPGLVAVERDPGRARRAGEMLCGGSGRGCAVVERGDATEPRSGALRRSPRRPALLGPRHARLAPRCALAARSRRRSHEMAATRRRGSSTGRSTAAAPGGRVVYSTCTISRRENEAVAAADCGVEPIASASICPALARLASRRQSIPADPAGSRRHRRVLHRRRYRPERKAAGRAHYDRAHELSGRTRDPDLLAAVLSRLRRAVAAADSAPRPLPLRQLPAALRARLPVPGLRNPSDDRADERRSGPALSGMRHLDAAGSI